MAARVSTLLAIAVLVGSACSGTISPTATNPAPSPPGSTATAMGSPFVTPDPSPTPPGTPTPSETGSSRPSSIEIDADEVVLPLPGIGSIAVWGPVAWYTAPDSHRVYRVDFVGGAIDVVAEAGRGYPSSIDANELSVAWTEWVPKPGRHSSWRVMSQVADGDSPQAIVIDESTDTRTGSLYDISSVLDLNGDAIAYTSGAPTTDNPLASEIRYGNLRQDEPFHQFETDLVPYDVAIGESGVLYSIGSVDPEAFGEIVDPKLMIYGAGSDAPQPVADDALSVALDGARMVWASGDQVLTAIVGATEHTVLSESVSDSSLPVAAAEGLVTWSEVAPDGRHLLKIWNSESGATYQADESSSPLLASIGGGWLAWNNESAVKAVSLEELRAAF